MPTERIKDKAKYTNGFYDGLSKDLKGFYDDYYNLTGNYLTLTSGKRKASDGVGKFSKVSKHNTGDAFDVRASHTEDYKFLSNTPEGLELMTKYNLGIIDETDPKELEKTGGTGAHFHIGKDSFYANKYKERYNKIKNGEKLDELIAFGDTNIQTTLDNNYIPKPFENSMEFVQPFSKTIEKEVVKEAKMDEDRKELVEEEDKYQKAVSLLREYSNLDQPDISSTSPETEQVYNSQTPNFSNIVQDFNPERFIYSQNI